MRPGAESARLLSDKPHSHSSKAESWFPPSVPFCHLPLIMSQRGKAGAPRSRSDTWHFLMGSTRNLLLQPEVVDSLPAWRSRPHWLHQAHVPGPCCAAQPPLHPDRAGPSPRFGSGCCMASVSISEKLDKQSECAHLLS